MDVDDIEDGLASHMLLLAVLDSSDDESDESETEETAKPRRTHRWWVRPWIGERDDLEQNNTIYKLQRQLQEDDASEFARLMRMSPDTYAYILGRIQHRIYKKHTRRRRAISADERLSITLKYLATGESFVSLHQQYRTGHSSVGKIVKATAEALYLEFKDEYLSVPRTQERWLEIARGYQTRWNYPMCLGSIDGKHVRIAKPPKSGSLYWNYKGYNSIVLFALVSASYEILYIDIGTEGRISDSGIWRACGLRDHLERGSLNIPPPGVLPNTTTTIEHHFIGDDAFPLDQHMMKPYGHRNLSQEECVFNYRLSRARRTVENVFGILASRFRILHTEMNIRPKSVRKMVTAMAILHNILNQRNGASYINTRSVDQEDGQFNVIPGEWRRNDHLHDVRGTRARNASDVAKTQRDTIRDYFNSPRGAVPWQEAHVRKNYGHI